MKYMGAFLLFLLMPTMALSQQLHFNSNDIYFSYRATTGNQFYMIIDHLDAGQYHLQCGNIPESLETRLDASVIGFNDIQTTQVDSILTNFGGNSYSDYMHYSFTVKDNKSLNYQLRLTFYSRDGMGDCVLNYVK